MKPNYISSLTPEELAAFRAKSAESKRLNKELREANAHLYKTDWADKGYWQELASKYNIRMPNELQAPTLTWMRKYANRMDITVADWLDDISVKNLQQWIDLNPKHTLYAYCGNLLEWKESNLLEWKDDKQASLV